MRCVVLVCFLSMAVFVSDCRGANVITLNQLERMLRSEVDRWHGTRYLLGGMSKSGVDCSGFVKAVFGNLFGVSLPRHSSHQATIGRGVRRSQVRVGDIVFFKLSKGNHVGIYLGRGQFAHASKSKGVTVSYINGRYWQRCYWTARRIFRDQD